MTVSGNESNNFVILHQQHRPMVRSLCLYYCKGDIYLAEEAEQETFMKLFQMLERGDEIQKMETFLHTILKNYIINRKVKASRESEVGIGIEVDEVLLERNIQEPSAEDTYVKTASEEEINRILRLLLDEMKESNPVWYTVVKEVFLKKRSQKEVAEELGITLTAMHATIRRIRAWSNRHRLRIEEDARNSLKEVPKGTSFDEDVEFTH